jgi:hypothetical protein
MQRGDDGARALQHVRSERTAHADVARRDGVPRRAHAAGHGTPTENED